MDVDPMLGKEELKHVGSIHALAHVLPERELIQRVLNDGTPCTGDRQPVRLHFDVAKRV
jgi:hypothetical protein